jgi:hypothetical protein
MAIKKFTPSHTSQYEEYISILPSNFGFSSKFLDNHNLKQKKYVEFAFDTIDIYKFYFTLSNNKTENSLFLVGHNKRAGLTVKGGEFVNSSKILISIRDDKSLTPQQRRFQIFKDLVEDMFYFKVIPNFERRSKPNELSETNKGIYRYINQNNEIIYIGIGGIKSRFESDERKTWINEVKEIEYSVIDDKDEREKYENIYLKLFKNQYGTLPRYNKNSGKNYSK